MLLTLEEQERYAEENMKLVHYFTNKFRYTGIEYDELYGIALVGYAVALKHYDLSKNVRFSTYAAYAIKSALRGHLRKKRLQTISLNKTMHHSESQDLALEDMLATTDNNLEDREIQILLDSLVKNENDLTIMRMYVIDRSTQKEIAKVIGCSQKQVSKKIRRICNHLKASLYPELEGAV